MKAISAPSVGCGQFDGDGEQFGAGRPGPQSGEAVGRQLAEPDVALGDLVQRPPLPREGLRGGGVAGVQVPAGEEGEVAEDAERVRTDTCMYGLSCGSAKRSGGSAVRVDQAVDGRCPLDPGRQVDHVARVMEWWP